jgi:hypothetical protein
MATIANQRFISIRNIIIYLEIKFLPNRDFFYFGGHFGFKMAIIANQRWISIRNMIIYSKPNFIQIGGFLYFDGHFGFKMTAIDNQRSILIRNTITMMLRIDIHRWFATVAILYLKWPPKYKIVRLGRNLVSK